MTGAQPDPAREWAEAWLEDHPDARPADVHRAVGVVYGKDEADRVVAAVFREPLTRLDIPAGQGPASLFLIEGDEAAVWFKRADGSVVVAYLRLDYDGSHAKAAVWDHLAATLPHVTTEEGP